MNITFSDISKRIRNRGVKATGSNITPRIYTENNIFCPNNAINAIMNWENLAENSNDAFNKALDIFEEVCINEAESTIIRCTDYLLESVDKVRDSQQLERSLKIRKGRLNNKITNNVSKTYDPVNAAIRSSIYNINKTLANAGAASASSNNINKAKTKAAEESFNLLLDECKKNKECDRIIENYNKISKRFNLDKIINEVTVPDDIYFAILEIARCIDTYSIPFKNKYSHTLEASYYALNKNNMNYPSEKIIEAVTDYFIFSSVLTEEDILSIKQVKEISVLYENKDFDLIDYLYNDDETEDKIFDTNNDGEIDALDLIESYCSPLHEDQNQLNINNKFKDTFKTKKKEFNRAVRGLKKAAKQGNPDERLNRTVRREIDEFRKQCAKDPDNKNNIIRLKAMITSIFVKSPEHIVYGLPNFFSIIRALLVLGSVTIHPILGLLTFMTGKIIKLTLSRKQLEKVVKAYQNEIDRVNEKLEKTKDKDSKENLEKYLEELNKDYAKIKEYENDLYSDEENFDRDTSTEYNKDSDEDYDDGLDWDVEGDLDWDIDFEEAASIIYIADMLESISEGLIDDNVEGIVFNNLYKLDNDSIDTLTDFSITVPIILEKDKLCEALIEHRDAIRESNTNKVQDYIRIDCLNENIHKLKTDTNVYATSNNLSGIRCYLACLNELVNMNASSDYITEMNFSNTLKLAVDRLKKTAVKLKDKDKQISNSIDVSVNNISKGIETALMNDNREAVIKGRILPSASKCIKLACVIGATWITNPVIAVITTIGYFACTKKLRSKERQLIIDDIDIELKMVDRYIKQAEDSNNLKKVRQLEIIQRNLLRQQQRIKYKMHVVYKQDASIPNGKDE